MSEYRYYEFQAIDRPLSSQDFVDRLVEGMTSFLLSGRAWTALRVNHTDRVVTVREAPRGMKPSWGGFVPQMLGFVLCQRMKRILTESVEYPYVNEKARQTIEERRSELGDLLRRDGPALQLDDEQMRWWTFAGGRINHTLKMGLEISEGWKVVADNFVVRIEGDGVTHETVRKAIQTISAAEWWGAAGMQEAILARLPGYRLSKFQDCLPERFALEMVAGYLLDVEGVVAEMRG